MYTLNVVENKSITFTSTALVKEFKDDGRAMIPVVCSSLNLIGSATISDGVVEVLFNNPGIINYLAQNPMKELEVDVYAYSVNGQLPMGNRDRTTTTKVRAIRTPFNLS